MKNFLRAITILVLAFTAQKSIAQFSNINYDYDATGNRWKRYITFSMNKTIAFDTTHKTASSTVYRESLLDSFGLKEIVVFPNPTTDIIRVDIVSHFNNSLSGSIKIFNAAGTNQLQSQSILFNNSVDLTLLATGMYVMRIDINGQIRTYKVLKN
jgi:hypothetical protein